MKAGAVFVPLNYLCKHGFVILKTEKNSYDLKYIMGNKPFIILTLSYVLFVGQTHHTYYPNSYYFTVSFSHKTKHE